MGKNPTTIRNPKGVELKHIILILQKKSCYTTNKSSNRCTVCND